MSQASISKKLKNEIHRSIFSIFVSKMFQIFLKDCEFVRIDFNGLINFVDLRAKIFFIDRFFVNQSLMIFLLRTVFREFFCSLWFAVDSWKILVRNSCFFRTVNWPEFQRSQSSEILDEVNYVSSGMTWPSVRWPCSLTFTYFVWKILIFRSRVRAKSIGVIQCDSRIRRWMSFLRCEECSGVTGCSRKNRTRCNP